MRKFKIQMSHPSGSEIILDSVASILNPHDNSIMFIGEKFSMHLSKLESVNNCLVFVLSGLPLPRNTERKHIIRYSSNPRKEFGKYLELNKLEDLPETEYYKKNGALISKDAIIGKNVKILPYAFVDQDVVIGNNCTIHSGVRLLPNTRIGANCEIHDNSVIGTVGLAYEDEQRIPQLGGVKIGNRVAIGANCVIARGAIEDTEIENDVAVDFSCTISHGVKIGTNVKIVAGTNIFGSVIIGHDDFISGNTAIKNSVSIGNRVLIGMGSIVIQNIEDDKTVFGNPARVLRSPN